MTIGTIEEKIDKMLEEKAALSADLIQSSQWLTELSDTELDDLLSFSNGNGFNTCKLRTSKVKSTLGSLFILS